MKYRRHQAAVCKVCCVADNKGRTHHFKTGKQENGKKSQEMEEQPGSQRSTGSVGSLASSRTDRMSVE